MHCLLWIADAPRYGVDDTQDVVNYIDSIVSCKRSWGEEELDSLVSFQSLINKHTRTCKKQIRKKKICRFGFPHFPILITCILQPLILGEEEKREMTRHSENLDRIKLAQEGLKIDMRISLWKNSYILSIWI